MPHIIRLRGPWEFESGPKNGRCSRVVQVPCDLAELLGADYCGAVSFSRRFNRPANLAAAAVWLALVAVDQAVSVRLNGESLDAATGIFASTGCDVSERLRPQNVLEIEFGLEPGRAVCFRGAELHIEDRADKVGRAQATR